MESVKASSISHSVTDCTLPRSVTTGERKKTTINGRKVNQLHSAHVCILVSKSTAKTMQAGPQTVQLGAKCATWHANQYPYSECKGT